jgi:hypothetical protein
MTKREQELCGGEDVVDAFKELATANAEQRKTCLSTLLIMTRNILEKDDPKYLKIKMNNKAFNEKVNECPGGTELVCAMGFTAETIDDVDYWVFPKSQSTLEKLTALRKKCEGQMA